MIRSLLINALGAAASEDAALVSFGLAALLELMLVARVMGVR